MNHLPCVSALGRRMLPWWGFSRSKTKFGSNLCNHHQFLCHGRSQQGDIFEVLRCRRFVASSGKDDPINASPTCGRSQAESTAGLSLEQLRKHDWELCRGWIWSCVGVWRHLLPWSLCKSSTPIIGSHIRFLFVLQELAVPGVREGFPDMSPKSSSI